MGFIEMGGSLFMVSPNQAKVRNVVAKRTLQKELKISGFINPSFCSGDENVSSEIEYSTITVGRISKFKNIFWLHKKCEPTGIYSLVITGKVNEYFEEDYYNNNKDWKFPQETKFDLEHSDVLNHFSKSGLFVSTCSEESYGITALEALSHGCSIALITNTSNHHSSEIVPARSSHYCNIKGSIGHNDFADLVKKDDIIL